MPRIGEETGPSGWVPLRWVTVVMCAILGASAFLIVQPFCGSGSLSQAIVDPVRLRSHVEALAITYAPRSYKHHSNLDACADYIRREFAHSGATVSEQVYEVKGKAYRNVIARFGPVSASRIIVGAHYDAYGDTPGADDNASGIAGLLELARLLGRTDLHQRIELVAYTLEEPPFFRSANMGSARHAARLKQDNVNVEAMICLEMIGFFSDTPGSQRFPSLPLRLLYPDQGNFIAVIGSFGDASLVRTMKAAMSGATDLPVYSMCAFKEVGGNDYSDHRNYWKHGYDAVMISDTAFFRNLRYHSEYDTPDRLDYDRMAKVVLGVYEAVVCLARDGD